MTTNELRDRLAMLTGWTRERREVINVQQDGWRKGGVWCAWHPVGLTIQSLIQHWPEGCDWERNGYEWTAYGQHKPDWEVRVADTSDEYRDRLALTVAVYEKIKEQPHA